MTTTTKEEVACNHEKPVLQIRQIKTETMSKERTAEETFQELADVNREFNALRDSMPKVEWERWFSAAIREM